MPLAVLAAGGCYKWIQLHDAAGKDDTGYSPVYVNNTKMGCLPDK